MLKSFRIKYAILSIAIITAYVLLITTTVFTGHSWCIIKSITGIPCPSCGSTRATILLFDGKFSESLMMNPFGILTNILIFASVGWMFRDIIRNRETFFPFLRKRWDYRIVITIIIIVLLNWIWNISKGL
jgi:hypothetical protein